MSADRTGAARRALTQAEAAIAKARAALDSQLPEPAPDVDDSPLGRTFASLDVARALATRTGVADVTISFTGGSGCLSLAVDSVASLHALADVLSQNISCSAMSGDKWYVGGPMFGADWLGVRVEIHLITDSTEQKAELRAWLEPLGVTLPADPATVSDSTAPSIQAGAA